MAYPLRTTREWRTDRALRWPRRAKGAGAGRGAVARVPTIWHFAREGEIGWGILRFLQRFPMTLRLLSLLALLAGIALPAAAQEPDLAVVGGSVLDVRDGTMSRANVLIADGRILSVGPEEPPAGVETLDASGKFVLPGFLDAHTHADQLSQVRRALESGVTTLRSASVGSYRDVAIGRMVAAGHLAGPDYLGSGIFVTTSIGDARLASESLYGIADELRSEADLRLLVRVNAENGVRAVKTRATERAGLPNTDPRKQVYTEAQLRAVVEEASALGIPVLCHAHGDEGRSGRRARRGGEHRTRHLPNPRDARTHEGTRAPRSSPPTRRSSIWMSRAGTTTTRCSPCGPISWCPAWSETMRMAREIGVRVIAGSDTSYGPESVSRIGVEVANFVKVGFSAPSRRSGERRSTPPNCSAIAEDTGVIEPGKEADLIVVVENPLEYIAAIQDVVAVVSNGRLAVNRLPFEAR